MRNICLKLVSYLIENYNSRFLPILLYAIEVATTQIHDLTANQKSLERFYNDIQECEEFKEISKIFDIKSIFLSSAYQCRFPTHCWKLKEVGFLLLGSFAEDILDYQNSSANNFNLESLMKNILNQIQIVNIEKIILARGLWCLSKFSLFLEKNHKDILHPLCSISIDCLTQNKEPTLKLIAVKSTSM